MAFSSIYKNKSILVTGHTGFKGSWLCQWLLSLGANVSGYALAPLHETDLFCQLNLAEKLNHDIREDLSERGRLTEVIKEIKPDFVFHLAAQSLVRESYEMPVETFATNVMGSVHVMDAIRLSGHPCSVVMVTTDKCYENQEWYSSYREQDPMGGYDPYSSSKGAAELTISSYRSSFFSHSESPIKIASVRAGNVIGGGDWAKDRIIPDCIRSIQQGVPISVRNKSATRPWQHVLEPLSGYLWLGAVLSDPSIVNRQETSPFESAFNFGPTLNSNRTVADLVVELLKTINGKWVDASEPNAPHEASKLNLAIDKAFHMLGWEPVWNFEATVKMTADWYANVTNPDLAEKYTLKQIEQYTSEALSKNLIWATA